MIINMELRIPSFSIKSRNLQLLSLLFITNPELFKVSIPHKPCLKTSFAMIIITSANYLICYFYFNVFDNFI